MTNTPDAVQATVQALSVRDLVRRRAGDEQDVWHLALVQRAEVWDHVRMRYLLDSLLNGYPIGSLLVCKATGQSRVIKLKAGERVVEDADPDAWQLLDGQQRINALFSIFTATGHYGHFYLHMTAPRAAASGPVTSRRAREQALNYIHWQQESAAEKDIPHRERYLDLSRWYAWTKTAGTGLADDGARLPAKDEALQVLNAVDPDIADDLEPQDLDTAWERLRRLLEIWREPSIPVQYVALGSPSDVLEIFTRVNRAGVQVAGQDLFFAAVKTFWNDAEQVLARAVKQLGPAEEHSTKLTPLVDRMGALRVLARLAARATEQADLVPLTVDRLSGPRGGAVIQAMRELSDTGSEPLRRMALTLDVITRSSKLGFGLYSVDDRLWDDVLGWAAVNDRVDDPSWVRQSMPAIDAYLFGATAFHYPAVLREPFSRLALNEAIAAGIKGDQFPTVLIAEVARTKIAELQQGRQRIRGSRQEEDQLWLADNNATLFLSVLQSIPYEPQRDIFDWDHIFPSAKAGLMWSSGVGGRRRHHQHRRFVGSAGNFWGLDAGANRAAQDKLPREKFRLIEDWTAGGARAIWPKERWGLEPKEIEEFSVIGEELATNDEQRIDGAMDRFHSVVTRRARRMVEEAFRRVLDAAMFAADSGLAGADPSPAPSITRALGIESADDTSAPLGGAGPISPDERLERILRLADERGSGPAIRAFVSLVSRLGLQVRPYQWTLTITPPKTKTIALIALSPKEEDRGTVETWVAPWAFAAHFPSVPQERFDEDLNGFRGVLLDEAALRDLGERVERVLSAA